MRPMKTRAEDLAIINNLIVPCILGTKAFNDLSPHQINMGYNETAVFQALLSNVRPRCAIELGTESGTKLAIMAKYSSRVISIDINPKVQATLACQFSNAEFITGDSHRVLPDLLKRLTDENTGVDFIFVDGDHSELSVRKDIENILSYRPTSQMLVLMHDTFNPDCRKGILSAEWSRNAYCHFVDLDFSPGILHPDEAIRREMWGGLGFALFLPVPRKHDLEVKTSHQLLFDAALLQSVYNTKSQVGHSTFLSRWFQRKQNK
jgi:hypothetical protein